MPAKDKYGNNIRRGARVRDAREDSTRQEGVVAATNGNMIMVDWDDGNEDTLVGTEVVVTDRGMR